MGVGEIQGVFSQVVDVWGEAGFCSVAAYVAEADVVGVDEHDVGIVAGSIGGRRKREDEKSDDESNHEMGPCIGTGGRLGGSR